MVKPIGPNDPSTLVSNPVVASEAEGAAAPSALPRVIFLGDGMGGDSIPVAPDAGLVSQAPELLPPGSQGGTGTAKAELSRFLGETARWVPTAGVANWATLVSGVPEAGRTVGTDKVLAQILTQLNGGKDTPMPDFVLVPDLVDLDALVGVAQRSPADASGVIRLGPDYGNITLHVTATELAEAHASLLAGRFLGSVAAGGPFTWGFSTAVVVELSRTADPVV